MDGQMNAQIAALLAVASDFVDQERETRQPAANAKPVKAAVARTMAECQRQNANAVQRRYSGSLTCSSRGRRTA
jgi:hypothetical protein